ncbi:MAG TPA: hypothetical protein VMU84_04255 [Thermoanaerobaculia bacterium]|nr:hypothetical protein [Thermoanaerobaculia bacterium]
MRALLALIWFACVGLLAWLAYAGVISKTTAGILVFASMFLFEFLSFDAERCPSCGRSTYGVNRSRCRVCGFELR